ncbi:MAG TPA: hypothetical protein VFH57_05250, partial [Gammaproteobacteria bacterium]|nr:hypothetical protein [Gammaproteobacteria bacterium]
MRKLLCLTSLLLLAGCARLGPLQRDQTLHLSADEGIAAIVIDSSQPLSRFWLHSTNHFDHPLEIQSVPSGTSLYLFKVTAGRYCVHGFMYGKMTYKANGSYVCFSVPAGQIGYSGVLMPLFGYWHRFGLPKFDIHVIDNIQLFRQLLKQDYPKVAAQFLSGFVPSDTQQTKPKAARDVRTKRSCDTSRSTCWWTETVRSGGDAIVIQNNS